MHLYQCTLLIRQFLGSFFTRLVPAAMAHVTAHSMRYAFAQSLTVSHPAGSGLPRGDAVRRVPHQA